MLLPYAYIGIRFIISICLLACTSCQSVDMSVLRNKKPDVVSPVQAIRLLEEGNQRFVNGKLTEKHVIQTRNQVVSEQKPIAVIISCSDSRVPPEMIFDQSLGNLFVIRVAGNVMNDDVLGSIGYAVDHLNVPLIMTLGHENCGAIMATLNRGNIPEYLLSIVHKIQPAAKKVMTSGASGEELINKTVIENIKAVEHELMESPMINKKLMHNEIKIVSGEYQLATGKVLWIR